MMTSTVDQLVDDYLNRLTRASEGLPSDRRCELLEEISEHIVAARVAGAAADEAAVRSVLDRLGDPEEIAASARDDEPADASGWSQSAIAPSKPNVRLESAAVALLTVGSLVLVVGWVVGVVLLWMSERWRTWEKLLGTLVFPLGPFAWVVLSQVLVNTRAGSGCHSIPGHPRLQDCGSFSESTPFLPFPVVVLLVVAPLFVGAYLHGVARKRMREETSLLVVSPSSTRLDA